MQRSVDATANAHALAGATEGLTSREARARLAQYGPNALPEPRSGGIVMLLRKFWGVIPWMLELALILELVLGRHVEAAFVAALLVFNALLGLRQETRAAKALALLRRRLTVNARARRDGRWRALPAVELVPGDLVRLRAGDIVPADLRLTEGSVLFNQAALTGESLPVERRSGDPAYSGSTVASGEANGLVTATGSGTYFGRAAGLVSLASAPPRLQHLVVGLTKYLAALDVILAAAVLAAALFEGRPIVSTLLFMLMLLVASIPVALPAMFTLSAALGARTLAERGILGTRLSAIEDAAAMTVLCLDKTGTLTENHLAVESLAPFAPTNADELLRLAALASDEATQDPIDLAILELARARGLLASLPRRASFTPFDPSTKRSEARFREGEAQWRVAKGESATLGALAEAPSILAAEVARLSAGGARVLAVAAGTDAKLHLAGLIALADPPRADAAAFVAQLRERGVRVLLVTGDGEATARAVAEKVGIAGEVAPPGTIGKHVDPQAMARFAVFARVFPEDKFLLVKALQHAGHVVGMTGDGVNDAPALRQADIGIAVANAADVAKAAAGLVLTRPGLGEIVAAVEASRRIYRRMQTFVLTMLTRKLTLPLLLALGALAFNRFVLDPLQIVLFMITTDVATMTVSADRVAASPAPEHWAVRPLVIAALGLALPLLLVSSAVFWAGANVLQLDLGKTQTLVFVWLVFAASQGLLYVTRARSFFWTKPHPGRSLSAAALVLAGSAALLAIRDWFMAPLAPLLVAGLFVLAIVFLAAVDLVKVLLTRLASGPEGSIGAPAGH